MRTLIVVALLIIFGTSKADDSINLFKWTVQVTYPTDARGCNPK